MLHVSLRRGAATAASSFSAIDLQSSSTGIACLHGCHEVAAHPCQHLTYMCKTMRHLACTGVCPTLLCVRQALPVTPRARDLPAPQLQAVYQQYL